MSHFNLIAQNLPENISQENQKNFTKQLFCLNNRKQYEFDSADYFQQIDMTKKEKEIETLNQKLFNPPLIQKKFPFLKQELAPRKKVFDSADYFLEVYSKADNCRKNTR